MGPFLSERLTIDAVPDLQEQMRSRVLPHSYESKAKQKRALSPSEIRRQAGGLAIRSIVNNAHIYAKNRDLEDEVKANFHKRLEELQVGRIVQARSQIKVPKDLILMKIAQQ